MYFVVERGRLAHDKKTPSKKDFKRWEELYGNRPYTIRSIGYSDFWNCNTYDCEGGTFFEFELERR